MKTIRSRDNPVYKRLVRLASTSQARKREGLSVLDGVHSVQAYLERVGAPAILAVSETGITHAEIGALIYKHRIEPLVLAGPLFKAVSHVEHGPGLLAAIATPQPVLPATIETDCLLIEHLQDPGNLGSLLRSAAAAGVRRVILSPHTVYAWSPKVLRAGQGAHFSLVIHEDVDLPAMVSRLRVPLLATSSHAAGSLYQADLTRPLAWLLGNEGAGVSAAMQALATHIVGVPLASGTESLNVAAAGAICMFETLRQRTSIVGAPLGAKGG